MESEAKRRAVGFMLPSALCWFLIILATPAAQAQNTEQQNVTRPRTVESSGRTGKGKKGFPVSAADSPDESVAIEPASAPHAESSPKTSATTHREILPERQSAALRSLFPAPLTARLLEAMESRIGIPYRFNGTDDSGYDCSGFVWRVFQDAGLNFARASTSDLWASLPEATEEEAGQFGTLVFFNGLSHVGIVRDAHSFYHASSSQGVILSSLDGYWGSRISGYRRLPPDLQSNGNSAKAEREEPKKKD
ncbi:MAG TPA: C40 family peptidase [Blastocatellia bacterium]|nr:C40 family peptidase [Blastocatellia bacterium]